VKNLDDDVISLLAELVKIPSVCGEEYQIASFILNWLRKNGVRAELVTVKSNRPNVIVTLLGSEPGPRIMLNGHMDTSRRKRLDPRPFRRRDRKRANVWARNH
jgi:acetylornithine deacetylase/succinyl-diaminopimelate desuccinylase-like protein